MHLINAKKTALILIDIQKGFLDRSYWGNRNNDAAESNAGKILNAWRSNGLPVFHIKHNSTNPRSKLFPGQPGNEFHDIVRPLPAEPVISKNVNSAFIGTDLRDRLDKENVKSLIIVGLTTDHCVSTTVRMAGNFGYETFLISDATAAFDKTDQYGNQIPASVVHEVNLASLNGEFATIMTTREILELK